MRFYNKDYLGYCPICLGGYFVKHPIEIGIAFLVCSFRNTVRLSLNPQAVDITLEVYFAYDQSCIKCQFKSTQL